MYVFPFDIYLSDTTRFFVRCSSKFPPSLFAFSRSFCARFASVSIQSRRYFVDGRFREGIDFV